MILFEKAFWKLFLKKKKEEFISRVMVTSICIGVFIGIILIVLKEFWAYFASIFGTICIISEIVWVVCFVLLIRINIIESWWELRNK